MAKPKPLLAVVAALLILVFLSWLGMRYRRSNDSDVARLDLLSLLPADASAVVFLDLQQLRTSPLLAQILSWAPAPNIDPDYKQFVHATGFDYERDLDRVAIAIHRQTQASLLFAIAEGRFDRKKIEAYAAGFESLKIGDGKTLFAVPVNGSTRKTYFMFLRDDRIAFSNDSSYFFQRPLKISAQEWHERFARVAGTPIFGVLRQEFVPESVLAQAPGGFRSPQLATLLSQLQWITISGKPDGNILRVVIDAESIAEPTVHQLKQVLSGLVVVAQVGLDDVKTRTQLDPELRQGYLDLLQSANIQEFDRGNSKSLRVVLEVTPKLLQSPPPAPRQAPEVPAQKPPAKKAHSK